jgi:hypothetical protein
VQCLALHLIVMEQMKGSVSMRSSNSIDSLSGAAALMIACQVMYCANAVHHSRMKSQAQPLLEQVHKSETHSAKLTVLETADL